MRVPPLRWIAVIVSVGVAAVATGLELAEPERLTVTIGSALPFPDPEDLENRLGDRYWSVAPTITAQLQKRCDDVRLSVRVKALANGRPVAAWDPALGSGGDEAPGAHGAGFGLSSREEAYGIAGYTLRYDAVATCHDGGSSHRAAARRSFQLPAASCDGGPLRVYELVGKAQVTDDDWDKPDRYELRVGHLVRAGWQIDVEKGGRVVLGAPECNGYAVKLGPGRHGAGSYDSGRRGWAFSGPDAEVTGDRHAGGYGTRGEAVEPLGFRCGRCPAAAPSVFEERRVSRTRSVVRVSQGAARVRIREAPGVRVSAGRQLSIVCRASSRCRTAGLRLYQPGEPWASPVAALDRPFARRVVTGPNARPATARLAPSRSKARLTVLPAGRDVPEQLLVAWSRQTRTTTTAPAEESEQGVVLWQAFDERRRTVWRAVYERRLQPYGSPAIDLGDMSGDGHPEVVYAVLQGSGACGLWRLLVTTPKGVREVLRDENCETYHDLAGGVFHLREPIGPCPIPAGAAHCYGGTRDRQLRWNGRRLVHVRTVVRCGLRRLDPARGCRPR